MADFYSCRFRAVFHHADGPSVYSDWVLAEFGDYLTGEPTREWSAETASHQLVGSEWGLDVPAGNARLLLGWEVLLCYPTVAELELQLRRREIMLNTHRSGTLDMEEAWRAGAPTMRTHWRAVIVSATVRLLPQEAAPGLAGAWGALRVELTLTHPVEE